MTHTFYNIITLPEGDDTEALKAWAAVGEWMKQQPGFLGSTLYRNRRQPNTLINKGRYETEEAFMASGMACSTMFTQNTPVSRSCATLSFVSPRSGFAEVEANITWGGT